jgi:SAM-dependent methyltransferase
VNRSDPNADDVPAHDSTTLSFYSAEAPVYVSSGKDLVNRRLRGFLDLLPPGARILELGCGGGRDAEAMIAAGFDVEPTDGTLEIARKAEERLGRAVRVMRFDELAAENAYDAVWASASLLHVPRPALPGVLGLIFRALKPGGMHFASYKGGGTEGRDTHGRYYNYPSRADLEKAYSASADWKTVSVEEYVGGGYDGRQGPWLAMTARRPE